MSEDARIILDFLQAIGLHIRLGPLHDKTFVPGIQLAPGGLRVDPDKLQYVGDLLHEAGHLAVMLPSQRSSTGADAGPDMGNEIAAQVWSYAAAVHLGLSPEVVFHEHGYHDSAQVLIDAYRDGLTGVPLLQWMGLAYAASSPEAQPGVPVWPAMRRWLREA